MVLNRLYSYPGDIIPDMVNQALSEIIAENEYGYQNLLAAYAAGAVRLIKAIAREGIVTEINAGTFIAKYRLKATSSINTALRTLSKKGMVYKSDKGYIVYDRFMAIWLRRQAY